MTFGLHAPPMKSAHVRLIVCAVAAVVPLWDFGSPDWLSDRPELWFDEAHFLPPVGTMMLDAILDPQSAAAQIDFGKRYGK